MTSPSLEVCKSWLADGSDRPLRTKILQLWSQLLVYTFSAVCAMSRLGIQQELLPGAWALGLLSCLLSDQILFSQTSRLGSAGLEGDCGPEFEESLCLKLTLWIFGKSLPLLILEV